MKTRIATSLVILSLFASCQNFSLGNDTFFKQAFGDALRSIEGAATLEIPALVMQLRQKWLPQGDYWTAFAGGIIKSYLAAHPVTNTEAQKALEALATGLQTPALAPTHG